MGFIVYSGGHKGSDPIGDRQVNGVYGGLWWFSGVYYFSRGHKYSDPIGDSQVNGVIKGYGSFRVMEHRCLCWGFYVNLW